MRRTNWLALILAGCMGAACSSNGNNTPADSGTSPDADSTPDVVAADTATDTGNRPDVRDAGTPDGPRGGARAGSRGPPIRRLRRRPELPRQPRGRRLVHHPVLQRRHADRRAGPVRRPRLHVPPPSPPRDGHRRGVVLHPRVQHHGALRARAGGCRDGYVCTYFWYAQPAEEEESPGCFPFCTSDAQCMNVPVRDAMGSNVVASNT